MVKNLPANAGDTGDAGSSLGREDALEEEMATHSGTLAWEIPWTEEPGGLQATESDMTEWLSTNSICLWPRSAVKPVTLACVL